MFNSTKAKGREVYAEARYIVDLLSGWNRVEDQILDLAKEMGDKAPQALVHAAGGVRARRDYAHATAAANRAEYGIPGIDYDVIPAPDPGWARRWRLRALFRIATVDSRYKS